MEEQHKERKASYKYSFRLDEQQNIRFCRMLAEAGLEHNRSRFIVKRIFAEEFRVVRIDPTLGRYVTRLNQFYEQIQRVGNNYYKGENETYISRETENGRKCSI